MKSSLSVLFAGLAAWTFAITAAAQLAGGVQGQSYQGRAPQVHDRAVAGSGTQERLGQKNRSARVAAISSRDRFNLWLCGG
jgi:hypothetical protein